jgi:hypothetical protein
MNDHRVPPGTDTLELVRRVRKRYGNFGAQLRHLLIVARNAPERLPNSVAMGTIHIRELAELIEQTRVLPQAPIMVEILRAYSDLVVEKVQKGL